MADLAHIIWNANAGSASVAEELAARLSHVPQVCVVHAASRDEAVTATRRAVDLGIPRVIAAGGDGTVSLVASTLLEEGPGESALGVLPLGTGNDLARSLGMPANPLEALAEVLEREISPIDAISAERDGESSWLFNMATAGNSGKFAESVTEEFKRQWGVLAYVRKGVEAVRDLTVYEVDIEVDGKRSQRASVLNLFLANGRTSGGGIQVAPKAMLNDGLLDYVVVLEGSPGALTSLAADYAFDRLLENKLILSGRTRSLRLSAAPPLQFSTDGEVIAGEISSFTVHPRALPAVVGPGAALERRSDDHDRAEPIPAVPMLGVV